MHWYGMNRTWCDCVEEVRKLCKHSTVATQTSNLEMIRSLAEELQVYGNRMEGALSDVKDLKELHKDIKEKKEELKKLKKKAEAAKGGSKGKRIKTTTLEDITND